MRRTFGESFRVADKDLLRGEVVSVLVLVLRHTVPYRLDLSWLDECDGTFEQRSCVCRNGFVSAGRRDRRRDVLLGLLERMRKSRYWRM